MSDVQCIDATRTVSGGGFASEVLERLLRCPYSGQRMLRPVVTPCGHTVDEGSARAHILSLRGRGKPPTCPLCRTALPRSDYYAADPAAGGTALPGNVTLQRIVDALWHPSVTVDADMDVDADDHAAVPIPATAASPDRPGAAAPVDPPAALCQSLRATVAALSSYLPRPPPGTAPPAGSPSRDRGAMELFPVPRRAAAKTRRVQPVLTCIALERLFRGDAGGRELRELCRDRNALPGCTTKRAAASALCAWLRDHPRDPLHATLLGRIARDIPEPVAAAAAASER